uniref:Sulfotransferase domain-containing protein n=1 Tax=viral metagenome TaxID=1070528 RepID=A0A6C0BC80_9ZZZZ
MASVDFNKKIIYLHVPKTAGTYIQYILMVYYNMPTYNYCAPDYKKNAFSYKGVGLSTFYNNSEFLEIIGQTKESIKDFFKIASVRNPYTKFISAWKFMIQNNLIDKDVDLEDVIKNKDNYSGIVYNHLFLSQYDHLKEWDIDYLIKLETLEDDINIALKICGIEKIHVPEFKNKTDSYGDPMQNFKNKNVLTFVNDHFHEDFERYGYSKILID